MVVADSTTVNLYKALGAALDARPGRTTIVIDRDDFPTDRYVVEGLAAARALTISWIEADPVDGPRPEDVSPALGGDVAVLLLSHVSYRSAAIADMAAITSLAHDAGALVVWDLSHAVGAIPIDLEGAGADLAVGCTYKYVNGGPGAPAFLYVRAGHQGRLRPPIWGWFGQRDQFALGPTYDPVETIDRFQVGTPPVLGVYAVLAGAGITAEAGIGAIHAKGQALTSYAVDVYDEWLAPLDFA